MRSIWNGPKFCRVGKGEAVGVHEDHTAKIVQSVQMFNC